MAIKHPRGKWTVGKAPRRVTPLIEIRNHRGTVAIVYTNEHDAQIMAASPQMLAVLKAFVRAGHSPHAHAEAIAQAKALIAELRS